jgi:uncharacterized sporulation protein YeaH/YhbH (DUF444 family)
MKALHEEYPLIKYNIYSANADDMSEKLEHGTLCFGLINVNIVKNRDIF